ncbi:MAG: hypothetical protein BroJett011_59610 [Chloroflexota bacterium]|nr:MAG: hypothetical protein BroJett011_59610 [Chloroflexota bacterium]
MSCNGNAKRAGQAGICNGINGYAHQSSFLAGRIDDFEDLQGEGEDNEFVPPPKPYFTPEQRVKNVRLEPSRLRVAIGDYENQAGIVVQHGQVVLRRDGSDTGLAIVPNLQISNEDGVLRVEEDLNHWWVLHVPSGRTISQQPYGDIREAFLLSSLLAQVDWTRDPDEISDKEYERATLSMLMYDRALAEQKTRQGWAEDKANLPGPAPQLRKEIS